ncbi:MAG: protein kinase, partial [Acidobacteriota bacterium]
MSTALEHLKGKYEILEKLQEGGMGAVYKVRHRLLDEVRVIKVVRPQFKRDEEVKARFLREARTVIRLRHHNIAQLYDFSIDADENAFIVMEFIDGVTFLELLRRARVLPISLVLEMSRQSLEALRYLHRRSIVHRDIAPDNLMLTRDEDGSPLVKLIDLGVAKALEGGSSFTVAGTFLGKVRYASPEQFRSQEGIQVEPRSDLYSFGVVLYQLLTGALPVRGTSLSTLIAGHLLEPPIPFSETDPEGRVPEDLRQLVLHALAKKPEDRPASAGVFIQALEEIQQRYPLEGGELDRLLTAPDLPTTKLPVVKPGSTQDRLDEQFRLIATALPKERPAWLDPRLEPKEPVVPEPGASGVASAAVEENAEAVVEVPTMATPLPVAPASTP